MATNGDDLQRVEPFYPFNEPGEPIVVHDGLVDGFGDHVLSGVIELRCSPKPKMVWRLDTSGIPSGELFRAAFDDVGGYQLRIPRTYGDQDIKVNQVGLGHGWIDGIALGSVTAPLDRIVVHWMNLPDLRLRSVIGEWNLSLHQRADHREIWETLTDQDSIAVTHAMALSRSDADDFSAAEASPILQALQYAMSFALGRWVAPALPVGFNKDGNHTWEQWASCFCEPGRSHGLAW